MSAVAGSSGLPASEQEPLLRHRVDNDAGSDASKDYASVDVRAVPLLNQEDADLSLEDVPDHKRQLGLLSTASLIFNRVIGTGIFATPSVILRSSGSVGLSLVMWLLGATVALCGTAVYIELGTGLPRNGGEKNYLEFIYQHPKLLVTCIYAMYAVLTGWQAASCSVFGEYALHALNPSQPPSPTTARLAGVLCITAALLLHGTMLKTGLHIQNALGLFKLFVLVGIALSGLASLLQVPGFRLENPPLNFEWDTMWEGTLVGGVNAFVTGLFNVIWCFIGYSNANYALAEVRDPIRTIKRAAPLAMLSVTFVYMLVNIAYLAVVDKEEIVGSGRIVAALHFGKLWGVGAERAVSVIVAFSTVGNILAVLFTHGRVVQELGREGVLPFSSIFASNKPFGAPFAGLFEQWLVTSSLVLLVPPGDAYLFMLNLSSYPLALINTFVSGGLVFIHLPDAALPKRFRALRASYEWRPPFRAWAPVVLFFFLSNVFLVAVPLVPPARGYRVYEHLPYWLHVLVAWLISFGGIAYWYVWCVWLPRRGGYVLVRDWVRDDDGTPRRVVRKVKTT
ncbi:amino acid transporter [Trametes versicolor FP-101664 SS1]|uniref:amino acid transporter n=1 Tax=Trametes versicolor (strain FP-101664) TaxID=717944 RepID=UPI00046215DE|nr:amino acid transporter [Trametes versicolor FP-101664 SS1]EIW55488.1 amino acid transporter [Trametes versicolor FP-101664 SS1]